MKFITDKKKTLNAVGPQSPVGPGLSEETVGDALMWGQHIINTIYQHQQQSINQTLLHGLQEQFPNVFIIDVCQIDVYLYPENFSNKV